MASVTNPSINCLFAIVLIIFSVTLSTNALQCYVCGQYNDGVGSITPCLNYSANLAHLHLKECPRKTDKFCIKYVSELSVVRDCVESCVEKEVWQSKTFCCTENGCNAAPHTITPPPSLIPLLLIPGIVSIIFVMLQQQHNSGSRMLGV